MEFFKKLKKYLFPPKCVFCRRVMEEDGVCNECEVNLPYRASYKVHEEIQFVDVAFSCFHYEGNVKNALLRYKFGGLQKYAVDFAAYLEDIINENLVEKYDMISWVPLSSGRLRRRGYDQARILAEEICRRLDEKPPVRTLRKSIDAAPQSRQGDKSRRVANIIGAYDIGNVNVDGKRIILIDDILTTGSTVSECARVLKTAGAAEVFVISIAKTRSRKMY